MHNRKRKNKDTFQIVSKRNVNGTISESRMKDLLQNRKFIDVENVTPNMDHINFSVCSYNILAQYQMKNNLYLYTHCENNILEWSLRWKNIKSDLLRMNCDIYCLQEVQCSHYHDDIEPAMQEMGYRGFLSAKTGQKLDGCAIFVKTNIFNFELSTFETVNFFHNNIKCLKTDNVGQVALLSPIEYPDSKICVANTHLFFNPNRGEVKLAELILMLSKIDIVSNSHRCNDRRSEMFYWPIILCGDLNSEPVSLIANFLIDGHLDITNIVASSISGQNKSSFWGAKSGELLSGAELPPRIGISDRMVHESTSAAGTAQLGTGTLSHSLRLRSSCMYETVDESRLVTAFTNADTCAVDYIFYRHITDKSVTPHLQLVSYLELLTSDEFFSFGGIPNKQHGSDHIPIVARFHLIV